MAMFGGKDPSSPRRTWLKFVNVRQDGAALPETHRHEKRTKVLLNPRNFPRQKPVHNSICTRILVNNFNWLARAEFSSKFPGMSLIGPKRRFAASQRYVRSWGLRRHAKTAQLTRLTQVRRDASALVGPRCAKSGPARGAFNWPRNSRSGLRLPYPSGHPGCSRASHARSSRNSCVSCL